MRYLLLLLFFLCYQEAYGFEAHVDEACARWTSVPKKLVMAIAKQESGHNPWAINVQGKGYMPKTKEEALQVANSAWASGKSFDVGVMQVNSYWLRKFGFTPEYVIEPRRNVLIGTWILSKEIERFGLGWKAVASYHTPVEKNPERGRRYAIAIITQLRKLQKGH